VGGDDGAALGGGEVLINRSTYRVKPFYLSSETVLPFKFNLCRYSAVAPFAPPQLAAQPYAVPLGLQ
jgi:hypothetical protein